MPSARPPPAVRPWPFPVPRTAMSATDAAVADRPAAPARRPRARWVVDLGVLAGVALLVGGAAAVSRLRLFESGDEVGYWLGVVGGVMMLVLLLYPLRKYAGFARQWGPVKFWFWAHMALGIGGPWLILLHSNFHIGSLNAAVALYSMLTVAGSGIVGRFIYVRVNRGLDGELTSLKALQAKAGLVEREARSSLRFAPAVEAALLDFERQALAEDAGWAAPLRQVFVLPFRQAAVAWRCRRELRLRIDTLVRDGLWDAEQRQRRERRARRFVRQYLAAVMRVAQYAAYERLFRLWHVAHLPFVFLLAVSAVVHVVAVHAY